MCTKEATDACSAILLFGLEFCFFLIMRVSNNSKQPKLLWHAVEFICTYQWVQIAILILEISISTAWFNSVRAAVKLPGISLEVVIEKLPLFLLITAHLVREKNINI